MYTFYSNTQVDDLIEQARQTIDDGSSGTNLYAQAEKMILTDMPAIPLYFYRRLPRHQQPHRWLL